jgi:hypothetical protein
MNTNITNLADLDIDFENLGKPLPVASLPQQWLANGYYTIAFPCGSHRTLRVHTQKSGLFGGKRLLSLLIGPENTADYEPFGELTFAGIQIWKRFRGQKQEEYAQLLWLLSQGSGPQDHSIQLSKRCMRCNRPLTTPESLAAGIGPECAGRG